MSAGRFGRGLRRALKAVVLVVVVWLCGVAVLTALYLVVPPVSTLMLARWATLRTAERTWMPIERIAPSLLQAVVASEDARFCSHRGVDLVELREAASDAVSGERLRGASTISMQVARNLFLWQGRDPVRKVLEIPIAVAIDAVWSKRRMLEIYLNIAEWGDGVFGAEAGARRHFNKPAAALGPREAALMAAVLPNPILRSPAKPSRAVSAAAGRIQGRIVSTADLLQCI